MTGPASSRPRADLTVWFTTHPRTGTLAAALVLTTPIWAGLLIGGAR